MTGTAEDVIRYDAIVVPSSGIHADQAGLHPTTPDQPNEHGVPGGYLQVWGAVAATLSYQPRHIIFASGSDKPKSEGEPITETDFMLQFAAAATHAQAFENRLTPVLQETIHNGNVSSDYEGPEIHLDETSSNVAEKVQTAAGFSAGSEGFYGLIIVGVITNQYREPRISNWFRGLRRQEALTHAGHIRTTFHTAEALVGSRFPGILAREVDDDYSRDHGLRVRTPPLPPELAAHDAYQTAVPPWVDGNGPSSHPPITL